MTRFQALLCIGMILFIVSSALSGEIMYARYPALSPDSRTIAFTYMGDIWLVASSGGEARRLTIHEAEDIRPHFSPDGRTILFSSRRQNNYDVFIIPVEGGDARQLTFHTATDIATGWFPGSDSVLFSSRRDGYQDIFKVAVDGGMPIGLTGYTYEREYNGRISADGRYLLYNNGSGISRWWRRDLRAAGNADIFLQDRSQEQFSSRRLTDYANHDVWPVLNQQKGELYFVSCRGEWAQIWKKSLDGGEAVALTDFTDDGAQWLNSNPQGNMLIFEQGFHIWIMDPTNGQPKRIPIFVNTDERENLTIMKTFNKKVEWFALSPDDKKIAAVVHGEIFVLPAEEPEQGKRITFTSARESYPVWGDDSRTLYYASNRDGNKEIYSADVVTVEEKRITETPQNEAKPIISPDGKQLAFYRGLDKIIRYEISSGREKVWVEGNFFDLAVETTMEYQWSPDSRRIIFSRAGATYETDIFMTDLEGETLNISRFAGWNLRPRISNDGKVIYFTSTINDRYDTYEVDLVPKPPEFFESSFDSLFADDKKKDDDEEKDNDDPDSEVEPIKVDTTRIENRRHRPYSLGISSTYPVISDDGEKYFFVASILGKSEIWSAVTEDDPELSQLTHSGKEKSNLILDSDGNNLYYLEDGIIKRIGIFGSNEKSLTFRAIMEIDAEQNNRQKFDETWELLNSYFYDPDFHGTDWLAVRRKYEPLLDFVRTETEFRNLIMEMMGELRASHMHIYSRQSGPEKNMITGELGIDPDYRSIERDGVFRIKDVLPGSPADMAGVGAGQYLRSINNRELSPDINLFKLLNGTEEHRLKLTFSDKPNGRTTEVELKPVSRSERFNRRYEFWVAQRRRIVDSLSDGRLGYLHIKRMYPHELEKFQQELVSVAKNKEGLIIDVRNNSGGSIAVHLLSVLVKTPYILRNFRGFPTTSENKMRSKAWEKPLTLLINNYSGSNSEIFAEGFRKLKLGKIIGTPTGGGVIGTAGYTLIDGTRIRRPSWGAFTTEMEDTDVIPRKPDIFVENLPDDFINGRDPQLYRAVKELLGELE